MSSISASHGCCPEAAVERKVAVKFAVVKQESRLALCRVTHPVVPLASVPMLGPFPSSFVFPTKVPDELYVAKPMTALPLPSEAMVAAPPMPLPIEKLPAAEPSALNLETIPRSSMKRLPEGEIVRAFWLGTRMRFTGLEHATPSGVQT